MIEDANLKPVDIVKNYEACQLTNVVDNEKDPDTQSPSQESIREWTLQK